MIIGYVLSDLKLSMLVDLGSSLVSTMSFVRLFNISRQTEEGRILDGILTDIQIVNVCASA